MDIERRQTEDYHDQQKQIKQLRQEIKEIEYVKKRNEEQYRIFFLSLKQILQRTHDTGEETEDPSPTGQPGIFG